MARRMSCRLDSPRLLSYVRKTQGRRLTIVFYLSLLVCSILLSCRQKDDSSQAAEAQIMLPKVQRELERAKSNMNSLSEQLQAVQFERNQLAAQVRQLTSAHDEAISTAETAGQSISEMTAKINEQNQKIQSFEDEINRLNSVIEEQGTTIAQQQTTIAELVGLIEQRPVSEGQQQITDQ
jgi:chromosome segregation ATPase